MFQVRHSENFPSAAKLNTTNSRIKVTADHCFLIDKVSPPWNIELKNILVSKYKQV